MDGCPSISAIDNWERERSVRVPGDLKQLWSLKGGLGLFETETILQPFGTEEYDLIEPVSSVRWERGLSTKRPEFHRRLILIATYALTAAGWGRFPEWLLPPVIFYAGVDLLILLGVFRDWMVNRKVHPVYSYALPAFNARLTASEAQRRQELEFS